MQSLLRDRSKRPNSQSETMFRRLALICLFCFVLNVVQAQETSSDPPAANVTQNRPGKYFSLFSVVRFSNDVCYGTNGFNGTCLTSAECTAAGGTSSGSCASGFGVCCIITISTCGSTATKNMTYWQNPGYPSTFATALQCTLYVKKTGSDICQVRLDFIDFILAAPEATDVTMATQCLNDYFTVSGSSNLVPTICGSNAGQHIYAHASPSTDTIVLNFITTGTATSRTWNILISQIPCSTTSTAPNSCLQWFTLATATFKSFNYLFAATPTVQHLANQDYTVCIRANAGFCGISYAACPSTVPAASQFAMSSEAATSIIDSDCLTDFIQIPCATDQQNTNQLLSSGTVGCSTKICGQAFAAATGAAAPATVYSFRKPFEVRVYTDGSEVAVTAGGFGFCLQYTQQPCTTASG